MFLAALFLTAKKVRSPGIRQLMRDKQSGGYLHVESDLATEGSEVHATTGMNLKTIMLQ